MKQIILDLIKQNDNVLEFLNSTGRDYKNADIVLPVFADKLLQTKFNAALGLDFANILQMTNDKALIDQYELEDISKLFSSLLKLQTYNLQSYVEAAHFEWSVMDDRPKAEEIAKEGLEKAKEKVEELELLLKSVNEQYPPNGA